MAGRLHRFRRRRSRLRRRGLTRQYGKRRKVSPSLFVAGVVGAAVSFASSLVLVLGHLGAMEVPGCGLESPCAEAAAGMWGAVPVIEWPTSFVGAAFFAGIIVGWTLSRGDVSPVFRNLVRVGALGSILLTAVMTVEGYFCLYCVAAHFGNLAFWLIVETSRSTPAASSRPVAITAATFAVCTAVLFVARGRHEAAIEARAEQALAESSREIVSRSRANAVATGSRPSPDSRAQDVPVRAAPGHAAVSAGSDAPPEGFTGRFRLGPKRCAIRVVAFTDYQCPLCGAVEKSLRRIVREYDDVSFSIKHFPACADCNDWFRKKDLHPNACRAARVGEAAGILQGDDGFWAMSDWLFKEAGEFSEESLFQKLQEMGLDKAEFVRLRDSDRTLRRIQTDIEDGISLGLRTTPMVFINGVELRGARRPDLVIRAIDSLRSKGLPPKTAEEDYPSAAPEKYVEEWRKAPVQELPVDHPAFALGDETATLNIVMWGDYQGPFTPGADIIIRKLIEGRTDARYSFRYFPVNKSCNPVVQSVEHLGACLAARCAEAAGILGGTETFWKMHDWLMRNPDRVFDVAIRSAAEGFGLNADDLFETMKLQSVDAAIEEDARAGIEAGLKRTPWIYINGKRVPRFLGDADRILSLIIDEASRSAEQDPSGSKGG